MEESEPKGQDPTQSGGVSPFDDPDNLQEDLPPAEEDEIPLPAGLRKELIELHLSEQNLAEREIQHGSQTESKPPPGSRVMIPQGDISETAKAIGDAPDNFPGKMASLISQIEKAGFDAKDEDPTDKERFIKGKGDSKIVPLMSEPTVLALDLTLKKDRKKYQKVMDKIARGMGTWQLFDKEIGPEIFIDPDSPKGYRAIVILKYCSVQKVVSVKRQAYAEVDEEELKKKFYTSSKKVETEGLEEPQEGDDNENPEPPIRPTESVEIDFERAEIPDKE